MELDRRGFLKAGAGAAVIGLGGSYKVSEMLEETPEEALEEAYPKSDVDLDPGYGLVIEVLTAADRDMSPGERKGIERLLEGEGFDVAMQENHVAISEEEFYDEYSQDGRVYSDDIIGEEDSFWADHARLKDDALQLMYVPGNRDHPYGDQIISSEEGTPSGGIAILNAPGFRERAAISTPVPGTYRLKQAAHEVGHMLGLEHVDDPANIMNPTMNTRMQLDFTGEQVETIKEENVWD